MLIVFILQALVAWIMLKVIAGLVPVKGGGVVMLFIISQLILCLKLFIKVLRYASVSSLMEQNLQPVEVEKEQGVISSPELQDLNLEFKPESDPII